MKHLFSGCTLQAFPILVTQQAIGCEREREKEKERCGESCTAVNGTLNSVANPWAVYHDKGDKYFYYFVIYAYPILVLQCWCYYSLGRFFFSSVSLLVFFFSSPSLVDSLLLFLCNVQKCSLLFASWHWKMQLNKLYATL